MGIFDQEDRDRRKHAVRTHASAQSPKLGLSWQHDPNGASHWRGGDNSTPAAPDYVARSLPKRLAKLAVVASAAGLGLIAVLFSIAMIVTTIAVPNPMALRKEEQAPVIRILSIDGSTLVERGQPYDFIPIDFLPRHMIEAVVATEDRRFFEHWGIDPWGMARAMFANLRAGRYAQGGSTLTQQLAKNLFLSSERRISRKVEELYLAFWLELRLAKSDILELYLNRVYFGGGAYGIEAAAQRYFNKSARALTLAESAVLAGLLKAPSKFSPLSSPTNARRRAHVVIGKMLEAGFISKEQHDNAVAHPIQFYDPPTTKDLTGFEYAIDYVLERLPALQSTHVKALNIETTIDATLQRRAQSHASALIAAEGEVSHAGQVSLVLMKPTGEITAMVGGANYTESQFNRATKARRQPGSTFKPFVYLAAVESGLTADSAVFDLPVMIKGYTPRNDNGTYAGQVTLRQALAQSINSVAVRLHVENGTQRTIAAANRLGVRIDQRDSPSIALGTSETSLLELAGAYSVFANGGDAVEPHIIKSIKTDAGEVIYQRPKAGQRRIVSANHIGIMSDMLNAALISGTGRRAALARHPAAGKTGTSQDFRDAWFIGYTAHYTAGIWVGNDNGKPMNKVAGGSLPARLWREVMTLAHEGKDAVPLPGTANAIENSVSAPPRKTTERAADPIEALMNQIAVEQLSPAKSQKTGPATPTADLSSFIQDKILSLPNQQRAPASSTTAANVRQNRMSGSSQNTERPTDTAAGNPAPITTATRNDPPPQMPKDQPAATDGNTTKPLGMMTLGGR